MVQNVSKVPKTYETLNVENVEKMIKTRRNTKVWNVPRCSKIH